MKIKNARFVVGAQIDAQVYTTLDVTKNKVEMSLNDTNTILWVKSKVSGNTYGVGVGANLQSFQVLDEPTKPEPKKLK